MTMRANKGNVVRFTSRILQRSGTLTKFCKVTFAGLVTTICEGWEVHQKHLITSMTAFSCIAGRYYYIWSTFLASPLVGIPRYSALFRQYLGKRMYIVFGLSMFAGIAEFDPPHIWQTLCVPTVVYLHLQAYVSPLRAWHILLGEKQFVYTCVSASL
jgi:hypothetical protein